MKTIPMDQNTIATTVAQLNQSSFFANLTPAELQAIAASATLQQYSPGEVMMRQGTPAENFALVVAGEVIVNRRHATRNEDIEVGRIRPFDTIGELGLLLDEPRSASIVAGKDVAILVFDKQFFSTTFKTLPGFALALSRGLARRLQQASRSLPVARSGTAAITPDPAARKLLPIGFIQRHRVLPLRVQDNILHLGFVEDPTPTVIMLIREDLPGMELRPVAIDVATYNAALQSMAGGLAGDAPAESSTRVDFTKAGVTLDDMLKRIVAERASDLHLSAGQRPRWRIDGVLMEIADLPVLNEADVMMLTHGIMLERNRQQFAADNDTDFAYAIPDVARFRVNLFRDNRGIGGVFRQIPDKILSIEQLGLPSIVRQFCDYPKGLVLVTGPTGSGKSTTLAAMTDYINNTKQAHLRIQLPGWTQHPLRLPQDVDPQAAIAPVVGLSIHGHLIEPGNVEYGHYTPSVRRSGSGCACNLCGAQEGRQQTHEQQRGAFHAQHNAAFAGNKQAVFVLLDLCSTCANLWRNGTAQQ